MNSSVLKFQKAGEYIFLFGLILSAFSLPLWNLGMSLGQFVMAGGWLIAGNLKERLQNAGKQPVFWLLIALFLMHVLGLWNTIDFKYGWKDIRVKLPLLLMPLLIAAGPPLTVKQVRIVFHMLFIGILISTLSGWALKMGWMHGEVKNFRDLSIYISHIRLSLLLDVGIVLASYFAWTNSNIIFRLLYIAFIGWSIYFLMLLQSITGLLLLGVLIFFAGIYWGLKSRKLVFKVSAFALLCFLFFVGYTCYDFVFVQSVQQYDVAKVETSGYSARGNKYKNDWSRQEMEVGRWVWRNYTETEMDTAWMQRSQQRVWDLDQQGHMQLVTLMRYLTYKNLSKDAVGVQALNQEDVSLIEQGYPTPEAAAGKNSIQYRLKELSREYRDYYYSGNASGHSFAQRLEYWKTSIAIIKQHPLTGVGTGDVPAAFQQMYEETNSELTKEWRLRSHNQYLSFGVAFGIPGILFLLFVLTFSIRLAVRNQNYVYLAFLLIVLGSFLNEDTLETQAGVTFYAFLNAMFLWIFKPQASLPQHAQSGVR